VKLVVREAESDALQAAAAGWTRWVSSAIAGVEVRRAALRAGDDPALRERAQRVLGACALLAVDAPVLERAAELAPSRLRSLDAIHLASALSLGDDLGAFAAYDQPLVDAARAAGIPVIAPAAGASTG
jgi:predicted nucleic acid-binding protein